MSNANAITIATELTSAAARSGHVAASDTATLPWFAAMHGAASTARTRFRWPVLEAAVELTAVELGCLERADADQVASFFLDACVAVANASELSEVWSDTECSGGDVVPLRPGSQPTDTDLDQAA